MSRLFFAFNSFFSTAYFATTFDYLRRHHNYTRATYIKSFDTQESSGEVSSDLAVAVVVLDVREVSFNFFKISSHFCLHWEDWGGLDRSPTLGF